MRTIWKYPFPLVSDDHVVLMPQGAEIIHVANQYRAICMWALVDPSAPKQERRFRIIGTGQDVDLGLAHVGSALFDDGIYVWHLFEVPT